MRSSDRLQPRDIAWRRLANQHLIGAPFASPLEVVRRLGAVQSQDYPGAKWGVAQRTLAATDFDVERALNEGAIVRTHVLRPTWHFVAAEDIRWMLALTAPRVRQRMVTYDRQLELDDKVYTRAANAIGKALAGGKQLTRIELRQLLQRTRIDTTPPRFGHLMMRAELDGLVCSGAWKGKESSYALLDDCVPSARAMEREAALAELAKRYFTTRGPATVHDFAWWSGLTVPDARRGAAAVQPALEHDTVDGRTYWFTNVESPAKPRSGTAHLLPNYDEYFIGLKDRSAMGEVVKSLNRDIPPDTFSAHVVVVDGQLVGGWRRAIDGSTVTLRVRLAVEITGRQRRAIEAQAKRYGEFLGLPVELALATASARRSTDRAHPFGAKVWAGKQVKS
jgi:hypothetical protein